MTNEEAVKILRRIQDPEAWEPQITGTAFEALDMAIKALGRQQAAGSGNLISRQDAIDAFNTDENNMIIVVGMENAVILGKYLNRVLDKIKQLPSAQPMRGRWLDANICGELPVIVCDQCNTFYPLSFGAFHNFCPNCGADMREVTT